MTDEASGWGCTPHGNRSAARANAPAAVFPFMQGL
nr:MAG TPA: hypothetical protein [Bacteriophage sp.]